MGTHLIDSVVAFLFIAGALALMAQAQTGYGRAWPWSEVTLWAAGLAVLAWDVSHLQPVPGWFWTGGYATSSIALLAWRCWLRKPLLTIAMFSLFTVSVVRACTFAWEQPERDAGIALNLLVAVASIRIYRSNRSWTT